ncbi:PREDICTED: tryparedoxin-like [Amphimedon queenslandica]|uniref:Thioredoxin domain-containing protein n=1 Tax=Amphimedon queenslandica TaxID=400682 RepID=A0A1X7VHN7_AMPQE|nr:PREDICTED: tryparedoxin-like [Amphimedon queenslandica]|eukprot:XP_003384140.2 PREDICTED: tryparedoxin-like [Amphimedon queenslandica]
MTSNEGIHAAAYISLSKIHILTLQFSQDRGIMTSKLFSSIRHFSFGKKGSRDKVSLDAIDEPGMIVGLLYSAYWCPACIEFTKKVARWYEKIQQKSALGKKTLEIVFISFDRDENEFNKHFDTMPWLAVPYEDKRVCNKLSQTFHVHSIPTLLLFDGKTGTLLTKDGKGIVEEDPDGDEFPTIVLEVEQKP